MGSGVLYVATSSDYLDEATRSVRSLRKQMPEIDTTLVTSTDLGSGEFDTVIHLDDVDNSSRDKIRGIQHSPYEQTLFLDTDTYVAEPVGELFELLDSYDLGIAHDPVKGYQRDSYPHGVPRAFPEFNTGVLVYQDASRVGQLFEKWLHQFEASSSSWDQPSFQQVLFEHPIRYATIPSEYNCRFDEIGHLASSVKIYHGRLDDYEGLKTPERIPVDVARRELEVGDEDSFSNYRTFTNQGGKLIVVDRQPSKIRILVNSIRRNGVITTSRKVVQEIVS